MYWKVGIVQIVEHPALDAAREGFIDFLAENGYREGENITYQIQNAQGDMANANTIAQQFKNAKLRLDPGDCHSHRASGSEYNQRHTDFDYCRYRPCRCRAGGVGGEAWNQRHRDQRYAANGRSISIDPGLVPDAATVGIIYNAGETNSVAQVRIAREIAGKMNLNIVEVTADNSAGVPPGCPVAGGPGGCYLCAYG